jgi:hypothetical protein
MNEQELKVIGDLIANLADTGLAAFIVYLVVDFLGSIAPHIIWTLAAYGGLRTIAQMIEKFRSSGVDALITIEKIKKGES